MFIRPMKESDLDQVVAIENRIFSLPWSKNSFKESSENEDNIYLVCDIDGVIAGYIGIWTVFGEGNVTNVAVSSEFRRRGIAKSLMQESFKYSKDKNVSVYFLEVRESNAAAIALYQGLGYKEIGRRKRFYEKPVEDALVMSLEI